MGLLRYVVASSVLAIVVHGGELACSMVMPRAGTANAVETAQQTWKLPVGFSRVDAPTRAVWDFLVPVKTQSAKGTPGVGFDFRCDDLALFSGFNFFLNAADRLAGTGPS